MTSISDEQSDAVRDALAIVRIIQRHGLPVDDFEAANAEMSPVIDQANKDQLAMLIGVLAAMAAVKWEDDDLYDLALAAIGMRE